MFRRDSDTEPFDDDVAAGVVSSGSCASEDPHAAPVSASSRPFMLCVRGGGEKGGVCVCVCVCVVCQST